jgi:serine/threonine protein kinase
MIGTVIDGTYRVDRLIGEGSYGVVYECTELELQRAVAIKMLKPGPIGDKELRRFLGEGRNLASLNHPNVVHIYRLGTYDGNPFIVTEFVRGQTLSQLIAQERPSVQRVVEIMRQVAAGLSAIHTIGILHRDLSANNILVTENGIAKILDLGLSKAAGELSSMESRGYLVGTLFYVSPEQVSGQEYGFRAEMFSFAVILYEALAGVHPFRAEHHISLLYNIAHRTPEPITTYLPDCPPALSTLMMRCLEKDPEQRPADMKEV